MSKVWVDASTRTRKIAYVTSKGVSGIQQIPLDKLAEWKIVFRRGGISSAHSSILECYAIVQALRAIHDDPLTVYSDSTIVDLFANGRPGRRRIRGF